MAVFVFLVSCAEGASGTPGETGGGGAGSGGGVATPEGCSDTRPCAPGKGCHNGACAAGCNTDEDCGSGEYCALEAGQFCQPVSPPSCPDTPCSDAQVCIEGLCGTQTGMACGANPFSPADGCPADHACLSQVHVDGFLVEEAQCYGLPSCAPGATCPVGSMGARCSEGVIDGKDPMCLPSSCLSSSDCPGSFSCVRRAMTDAFGRCSDGAVGSLCATTADCVGSSCVTVTAGLLGVCQ